MTRGDTDGVFLGFFSCWTVAASLVAEYTNAVMLHGVTV